MAFSLPTVSVELSGAHGTICSLGCGDRDSRGSAFVLSRSQLTHSSLSGIHRCLSTRRWPPVRVADGNNQPSARLSGARSFTSTKGVVVVDILAKFGHGCNRHHFGGCCHCHWAGVGAPPYTYHCWASFYEESAVFSHGSASIT